MQKVNITPLHTLVVLKKRVDEGALIQASEDLYRSIKGVKIEGTVAFVDYGVGKYAELTGTDIPEEIRAMAEYVKILMERWPDLDQQNPTPSRLDRHYGLSRSLEFILGDKIIKRNNADLDIIGICDVINTWLDVFGEGQ